MAWYNRLLSFLRRDRNASEIQREISFHLSERADDLMAGGMSKHDAMREARRLFGKIPLQTVPSGRGSLGLWFESVLADIRYAARSLRHSPGFTAVAILSLGLGIGANTAIFSLYNALMLRALPVRNPQELVQVTFGDDRTDFTNPLWEELYEQQDALSGVFAFVDLSFNLADGGEVRNVSGNWVSGDFFPVLGVRPVVGRLLGAGDDYRGCPPVAVISFGFWQREFGGSADVVGRTLTLEGSSFEVVGVVDPAFSGVNIGTATDVYTPLCTLPITSGRDWLDARSMWFLSVLGRPGPGLTAEQASARLAAQSPGIFGETVPPLWDVEGLARYQAYTFSARSAPNGVSNLRGRYRDALLVLMAAVGVVLLIACGNVANLLLARATKRSHEVAIRRAIGSGRARLVRLLVTESLLLSILSAVVAVFFARWASAFLVGMLSDSSELWLDLRLDFRVLGFTMAVAAGVGVLFGLAPAWSATGVAPQAALRTAGRENADRCGRFATGKVLVVGQLALSLALVVGAGLLIGTLTRLNSLDMGFDRDGVLLISIDKRNTGYSPEESRVANQELLERMRSLSGVRSASASRMTPIGRSSWNNYVDVDGFAPPDRDETLTWLNSVSDAYFATLGTPFTAGRDFDSRDAAGAPRVAVVNETMARKFFGEPQPLGRHFRLEPFGGVVETYEVIGVVVDTKYRSVDEETRPIAYLALNQSTEDWGVLRVQLRADGAPTALISAATNAIAEVHPRLSVRFSTLADDVAANLARPRLLAVLAGFFGSVALLLAMIGLYGTLSYRVTSRRNEIGVRLALGSARTRVLGMVLGEVGRLVLIGILIGVVITFASMRLLATFLFGVSATDPTTVGLSAAVLAVVAITAGALPAWQAARLDPMVALREE
ncbi:ADOP family duplicated permease [Gemmatimonadota bacterium]